MTLVELQLNAEGKKIGVNMDQVQTIAESTRTDGFTTLIFNTENHAKYCIEVSEPYESVMSKVRVRQ